MQGNLKSQADDLMETKEEKAQTDKSSDAQSWISSKKEWALFSEEEIKQYAQGLLNEKDTLIHYTRIEEFYRQPDCLLMLDEPSRTKLIDTIIKRKLKGWYIYHNKHTRHERAIAAEIVERPVITEEQRNHVVDQLFESINDTSDDSSLSVLMSISELTDTLKKMSEERQQQMVKRIIEIIKAGNKKHVTRIVDVIIRLSLVLPELMDKNGQEIRAALKEYVTAKNYGCDRIVEIAKLLDNDASVEIKKSLVDRFLSDIDSIREDNPLTDLKDFLYSDIEGIKWLFEDRISAEKQKEIISPLLEKIQKKDDERSRPCYAQGCHVAAIVLPRFSRFLSSEEKQEVADYSISEFFSLIKSKDFKFTAVAMQMAMALMDDMPEYISGRELDILKQLLNIVAVVHTVKKSSFHLFEIDLVPSLHRFSDFFPELAEDEQLQIMDWFMTVFKCTFLYGEPRDPEFDDELAQTIAAVGACIKGMKPELAMQWLEKSIDTLLSDDVINNITLRNQPVFKLAFVDLIIACLDSMPDDQKKHFLNYMHPRILELMKRKPRKGWGEAPETAEKNYFMGMLLMICADCETKQQTKLYALSGLSKWSPYCGMFTDEYLYGMINRLSDGALSACSTKHNNN